MALVNVHKIMMGTACLFSAVFAARCLFLGQVGLGGIFVAITIGLAGYFYWFLTVKASGLVEE